MIDVSHFMLFAAASWILIVTPGPDMIYVITRGICHGQKAGMISAVGVTLGLFVHTIFAALGLAVILSTSAMAFRMVKYTGALYLFYLGLKTLKEKTSFSFKTRRKTFNLRIILLQGVLSNVFNPKVALFFLAFLPQFVNAENGNVPFQMVLLGLCFAVFGFVFLMAVGYFSGSIGRWIHRNQGIANKLRWITGSILIALGIRLALIEQN